MVATPTAGYNPLQYADIEYLTMTRFYFEYNNNVRLLITKASGVNISIDAAGDNTAVIGIGKGIATQTQITPAGVTYQNVTLEFVTAMENDALLQWYVECHPKAMGGGGRPQMQRRFPASLVFYKQDGTEGARWNFVDAIPQKYTTTQVKSDGTDLFKETIEIAHAGLIRTQVIAAK